ncbi:hypothetical protein CHS0354_020372, partial [Potamilus streckersoni]
MKFGGRQFINVPPRSRYRVLGTGYPIYPMFNAINFNPILGDNRRRNLGYVSAVDSYNFEVTGSQNSIGTVRSVASTTSRFLVYPLPSDRENDVFQKEDKRLMIFNRLWKDYIHL